MLLTMGLVTIVCENFARDGHFENMLTIDTASTTEWRYGPFLTTRLSPRTAPSFEAIAGPGKNQSVNTEGEYNVFPLPHASY